MVVGASVLALAGMFCVAELHRVFWGERETVSKPQMGKHMISGSCNKRRDGVEGGRRGAVPGCSGGGEALMGRGVETGSE